MGLDAVTISIQAFQSVPKQYPPDQLVPFTPKSKPPTLGELIPMVEKPLYAPANHHDFCA